jgi:hypothetical protein
MARLAVGRLVFASGHQDPRAWSQASWPARWLRPSGVRPLFAAAVVLAAFALGCASTLRPLLTLAAFMVLGVVVCVWVWPASAAFLLVSLTPFTAGIGRGMALPLLRPNEALAALVGAALAVRGVYRWRTGSLPRFRLSEVDVAIGLLAVTSSVVPLLWMAVRQQPITHDDLLYALVLWKYLAIYLIVRSSVTTTRQVEICLWLSVTAACVVAVTALLQVFGLFGVPRLLAAFYAPYGNTSLTNSRGSSLLALPAATGDLLIYNLAVVGGFWMKVGKHRAVLSLVVILCVLGVLASGEFSTMIGLLVALISFAIVAGAPFVLSLLIPGAAVGGVALWPVISTYFWPRLFSHWNFILGVQPAARVPVASQITGYVWIESGYTWLLWGGGIPLLGSFLYFVYATTKMGWKASRTDDMGASIAGMAVFVGVIVMTVLMAFDPHLTYRGSADALFFLLALAVPRASHARAVGSRVHSMSTAQTTNGLG